MRTAAVAKLIIYNRNRNLSTYYTLHNQMERYKKYIKSRRQKKRWMDCIKEDTRVKAVDS